MERRFQFPGAAGIIRLFVEENLEHDFWAVSEPPEIKEEV